MSWYFYGTKSWTEWIALWKSHGSLAPGDRDFLTEYAKTTFSKSEEKRFFQFLRKNNVMRDKETVKEEAFSEETGKERKGYFLWASNLPHWRTEPRFCLVSEGFGIRELQSLLREDSGIRIQSERMHKTGKKEMNLSGIKNERKCSEKLNK